MIEIHNEGGRNCPMMVCDMCGERLVNARAAAVVFENFTTPGAKVSVLHVHKGNIDGHTCHAEAEAMIAAKGASPGWQEMATFLVDMMSNVGFSPADAVEHEKRNDFG